MTDNIEVGDNMNAAQTDGLSKKELEKKVHILMILKLCDNVWSSHHFETADVASINIRIIFWGPQCEKVWWYGLANFFNKKISDASLTLITWNLFSVAFIVDPLYHQTSAQFDEGGAKGLLLNNLGIYGGCRVLFDSFECPESSIPSEFEIQEQELIDLSFAKGMDTQMKYLRGSSWLCVYD